VPPPTFAADGSVTEPSTAALHWRLAGLGEPPERPEGSGEPRRGAPVDPEGSGEPRGGAPVDQGPGEEDQ